MTGKELLLILLTKLTNEELKREISMEGCDCTGSCNSVSIYSGKITLQRDITGDFKP